MELGVLTVSKHRETFTLMRPSIMLQNPDLVRRGARANSLGRISVKHEGSQGFDHLRFKASGQKTKLLPKSEMPLIPNPSPKLGEKRLS
jgi:hypothetical protein